MKIQDGRYKLVLSGTLVTLTVDEHSQVRINGVVETSPLKVMDALLLFCEELQVPPIASKDVNLAAAVWVNSNIVHMRDPNEAPEVPGVDR